jgi:hypothetical protein
MSNGGVRTLTFAATPPEVFHALTEAARRTGFTFLSSDASAGTAVFTSSRVALNFGDKLYAHLAEVAPGATQVSLSSELRGNHIGGLSARMVVEAEVMAEELSRLLPPSQ